MSASESVTESLYKQNLELSVKNKTLSLLRQLYQISILSLEPAPLASKITQTVREILEFELVGILMFDQEEQSLVPLKFSLSERFGKAESNSGYLLETVKIPKASDITFFFEVFKNNSNHTENISDVWGGLIPEEGLKLLTEESNIKNLSAYPLIIDEKFIGVLLICLNRTYEKLNQFEKESITSLADVTAVAIDRARLYQELQIANTKLKELDQLKSEFLSLATHQLRAPLTAIMGYASMLLEGDYGEFPAQGKGAVDIIVTSCKNLVSIVGEFLDISRIEQGRMVYNNEKFDMRNLVAEVVSELKPNIEKAKLTVTEHLPEGEDWSVNADKGKIKQIIGNLIDNAIKYTPQGGIEVSISDGDKVRVSVKDSGIGIESSEIGKLFAKFSRTKDAHKTNTTGTGLGLFIAKKMLEAQDGNIGVTSEGSGKGSTFYIELPKSR